MTAPAACLAAGPAAAGALGPALADELVLASRLLNDLAYDLGSDDAVLRRHLASLQTVDHVTQILLTVADLLRRDDGDDDRLATVTLEDMAHRLRTRMTTAAAG